MGQLAQTVGRRDEGKLPSQPANNPRGQYGVKSSNANNHYHEQAKAVTTLRSGKEVDNRVEREREEEIIRSSSKGKALAISVPQGDSSIPKSSESVPTAPYVPKAPYPTALADPSPFGKIGRAHV